MFNEKVYICPYCGGYTSSKFCCGECFENLKDFMNVKVGKTTHCDGFFAPFLYEDLVRIAILKYKFRGFLDFRESFCHFMAKYNFFSANILVCVPSFNCSEKGNMGALLAKRLAKFLKIKYSFKAVKKIKNTKSQHESRLNSRLENLNGCFLANGKLVCGKTILICDDIITTGATVEEMAKSLKEAGAKEVYALAVAVSGKKAFIV